ncbi:hypothetical protein EBH_0015810 [Eimeria brunetti]|uniref:Uncharacterized protein n=1 Tax=Eimeria brunetti TaxID=51314 RepID=U6LFN4_9EIME|nr:hypothetical protein EBH_0015810 [Eimeria brunetti]
MVQPTVRKQRSGFFSASDGVAELSDEGRLQVELLRQLFVGFVQQQRRQTPETRRQLCFDVFFTSTLQSGIETCLETFTGLLDALACPASSSSSSSSGSSGSSSSSSKSGGGHGKHGGSSSSSSSSGHGRHGGSSSSHGAGQRSSKMATCARMFALCPCPIYEK